MRPKVLRTLIILAAFGLLLGMVASASAVPVPFSPGYYVDDTKVADFVYSDGSYTATSGDFAASVSFDPDPSFIWSVNATNGTGADLNVSVIFPVFATPGYPGAIALHSSSSITATDNTGEGRGTAYVNVLPFFGFETTIDTNYTLYDVVFDVDGNIVSASLANYWGSAPTFTPVIDGNSKSQDSEFFGTGLFGPNDYFLEIVSFTLSPYDSTGQSGNCQFVVPLPPSVLLLGSGMLGMGLVGWRRRRQSKATV
jgi:hypothetical protein